MDATIRKSVEEWLRASGCTPVEQQDVATDWHVRVDYPVKSPHVIHVAAPKVTPGAVVIATAMDVGREHREAFEALDDEAKAEFLWDLRRTLNQVEVDFQLEGARGELDLPTRFQVSQVRFDDGLTRDSFMRGVGTVFKVELKAAWLFQERLGSNGHGPSGRFDFKRLGL
jgi:hypothetical protein